MWIIFTPVYNCQFRPLETSSINLEILEWNSETCRKKKTWLAICVKSHVWDGRTNTWMDSLSLYSFLFCGYIELLRSTSAQTKPGALGTMQACSAFMRLQKDKKRSEGRKKKHRRLQQFSGAEHRAGKSITVEKAAWAEIYREFLSSWLNGHNDSVNDNDTHSTMACCTLTLKYPTFSATRQM